MMKGQVSLPSELFEQPAYAQALSSVYDLSDWPQGCLGCQSILHWTGACLGLHSITF